MSQCYISGRKIRFPKLTSYFGGATWSSAKMLGKKRRFNRNLIVLFFFLFLFFLFVSAVLQMTQSAVSTENPKWTGFCCHQFWRRHLNIPFFILLRTWAWIDPLQRLLPEPSGALRGTRVSSERAFWTLTWTCVLGWLWTLRWSKAELDIAGCLGDKVSSSGAAVSPLEAWSPVQHCNTLREVDFQDSEILQKFIL